MEITQIGTVQQYKSDVAFKTLVEGVNESLYSGAARGYCV